MAALDFPASPTTGQEFTGGNGAWTWDGAKWVAGSGTGFIATIGDTPPSNPVNGNLWWNSVAGDGQLYISYNDGTSQQWVVANNLGAGIYLPLTGGTLSGPGNLGVAGNLTVNGLTEANGLRAGGIPNVGGYTWAQINTYFNTLANSGTLGLAWNYTTGGGETDFFINRDGGTVGGLNIYDFPNTSATPALLLAISGQGTLGISTNPPVMATPGHVFGTTAVFANHVFNAYLNSTPAWVYLNTGPIAVLGMGAGQFVFYTAPSGTGGTVATLTQIAALSASGVLNCLNAPGYIQALSAAADTVPAHGPSGMIGLGYQFTPKVSTRVLIVLTGSIVMDGTNQTCSVSLRIGTGTPPVAGAAVAGTQINLLQCTTASNIFQIPATLVAIATGLIVGTTYWIDVYFSTASGTGDYFSVCYTFLEV